MNKIAYADPALIEATRGIHLCPMCGAERTDTWTGSTGGDETPKGDTWIGNTGHDPEETIRHLAAMADRSPVGLLVCLLRIHTPGMSMYEASRKMHREAGLVARDVRQAAKLMPGLAGLLGLETQRTKAQVARRAREAKQRARRASQRRNDTPPTHKGQGQIPVGVRQGPVGPIQTL